MRSSGTPTMIPDYIDPPSPFDTVKELMGHAGRLSTFVGLVIAATSFSLTNGPIHDAIVGLDLTRFAFLYVSIALLAFSLVRCVVGALNALDPPLPTVPNSQKAWSDLITYKREYCKLTKRWIAVSLVALAWSWSAIIPSPAGSWLLVVPAVVVTGAGLLSIVLDDFHSPLPFLRLPRLRSGKRR